MEALHLAGALIEHLLELKCFAEALHIVTLTQKIYTYLLLFSFYIKMQRDSCECEFDGNDCNSTRCKNNCYYSLL